MYLKKYIFWLIEIGISVFWLNEHEQNICAAETFNLMHNPSPCKIIFRIICLSVLSSWSKNHWYKHFIGSPNLIFWMNSFAYLLFIFYSFESFSFIKIIMSDMILSTTDFMNLYKLSTWEVFENHKLNHIFPNIYFWVIKMCKLLLNSLILNTLITRSIIIE